MRNAHVKLYPGGASAPVESVTKTGITFQWQAWLIWGCAGVFYLYEMILRASPGVMTQDLMRDFQVTSTALGVLSSCYYYAYVLLQVPCGVIVDWLGTRKVITFSALLCVVGSLAFALSNQLWCAQVGRFLIGAGSACAFISCLKIASDWFRPIQFAMIAGLTNMMGTLGGTFSGPPFAMLINYFDWRTATLIAASIGALIALLAWIIIKDAKQPDLKAGKHQNSLLQGLTLIVSKPKNWLIACFGGLMYVPISAFSELWAIPYLMERFSLTNTVAAQASVMLFIGVAAGSPVAAWLSQKFGTRFKVMAFSALGTAAIFTIIAGPWYISFPMMYILLFFAGVFNSGQILSFAVVQQQVPLQLSATAVGFTNAMVMMSGIIFQPVLGLLLEWSWDGQLSSEGLPIYSLVNYQFAIGAVPICALLSLFLLYFARPGASTFKHPA